MAFGDSVGLSFPAIGSSRMRIMSMWTLYLTSFIGATGYSIIMASALPFLQQLKPSVETTFYGYIVGAYSLGQLLGSPVLGVVSNYMGFMIPFQFCLVVMFIANMLYGCLNAFSSNLAPYMMLLSRFLIGIGSGNVAIVRSFASVTSTMEERTSVLANITAAQALGFIIGPLLQTFFVFVGETGLEIDIVHIRFSMYTLPVFLSAFLCVINLLMFWVYFTDGPTAAAQGIARRRTRTIIISDYSAPRRAQQQYCVNNNVVPTAATDAEVQPFLSNNERYSADCVSREDLTTQYSPDVQTASDDRTRPISFNRDSERDTFAIILCIYLWIVVLTTFSFYETLVTPILEVMTTWTPKEATLVASLIFGGCSIVSFATMLSLKFLARSKDTLKAFTRLHLKERHVLATSLVLMTISFVIVMPYSSRHLAVYTPSVDENQTAQMLPMNERRGCDSTKYDWCEEARKIYLAQLIIGGVVNCVGYAASVVLISTIFSKIIGPFPQGVLQGALTGAGSIARFVGPLLVSQLFTHYGPFIAYFTQCVNIAVCTLVQIVFNRRFIQHILTREFGVSY